MPEAGGEYVYLTAAFGPIWGYLYGWTQLTVAKSGSIATLAAGFYTYLIVFFPSLSVSVLRLPWNIGPGLTPLEIRRGQLVAIAVILILAVVNYLGVRSGGAVQVFVTVLKMLLLAGVIAVGLVAGPTDFHHLAGALPVQMTVAGIAAAMVSALWAYDGWNNVSMVSSEILEPRKNLPKALILGTSAVIATYLLINLAYFHILSAAQVAATPHLAADMLQVLFGLVAARIVTVAVLISIFAALNGSILSGSRIPYAMANDGLFFRAAGVVHPRYRTPGNSIVLLCAWSCVVVLSGWYDDLYNFVIFGSWILYLLTAISVFILRRKRPDMPRPYRVIGYPVVPGLFVVVALFLLISTLLSRPRESIMGLGLMVLGLPLFVYWDRKRKRVMQLKRRDIPAKLNR